MGFCFWNWGGREERGREKRIRFLDSAFSGGLVFFFFSE